MENNTDTSRVYYSVSQTAKRASMGRTTLYRLNQKYHFIRKLGSRSIVCWKEFEDALMKESTIL